MRKNLISASLVAYSFARFNYRGRDALFLITLATMMLPAQVTLIPQFVLFYKLGWLNTLKPLWIPHWFGGGAFAIFLLRQFMMSLPREYDEAATIDGANAWQKFIHVTLPAIRPIASFVVLLSIIGAFQLFAMQFGKPEHSAFEEIECLLATLCSEIAANCHSFNDKVPGIEVLLSLAP